MFSNKAQLQIRTPENGTDRENFLTLLVDEFLNSTSYDAKCQVLANLANFAYDPINYVYIRDVGVLDIFLYVLNNDSDLKLLHFACAGISNLCVDPLNAEYILQHSNLKYLTKLLHCQHDDIVADTIACLIYMYNEKTKSFINIPEVNQVIQELKDSNNKKLANLANIYIENVCSTNC